jgi:hypothetical protein
MATRASFAPGDIEADDPSGGVATVGTARYSVSVSVPRVARPVVGYH